MKLPSLLLVVSTLLLSGCDLITQRLGLEDPAQKEAKADAEGRAVGSACRQSGRAIEDCYSLYAWLPKASVFAGWREMNDYMQSNSLKVVEPRLPPAGPDGSKMTPPKVIAANASVHQEEKPAGHVENEPKKEEGKEDAKTPTKK